MEGAVSSTKYIIFFAVLCFGVPIGYYLANRYPKVEKIIFFLMVFFTVKMEDINFVSRETYRGTSKGFEIGLVDICTFIIFLLVLHRRPRYPTKLPPAAWLYGLYFLFSLLSIVNSAVVLYSAFEIWKMIRMFIFWWVVYNYLQDMGKIKDLLIGIAAITAYVFYEVFRQKYFIHKFQTAGPFPHQNSLVMYMNIFTAIIFSYLLNKDGMTRIKFWMWFALFAMGAVCIISSLSRAGMVLFGLICVIILGVSIGSGVNGRKIGVAVMLVLLSLGILYKAWDSISERFKTAPEASANTRVDLAIAAVKMANDKTLGIGLNNFGYKINPPYPYSSHIEMHNAEDEDEKNGLVETTYLMIAAETGWHNLVVFFLFLFYYYFLNLSNFYLYKRSEYRFIPIALVAALLATYLESSLEWVLKQTNNFYQLMLIFGLIGAMNRNYKRQSLLSANRVKKYE